MMLHHGPSLISGRSLISSQTINSGSGTISIPAEATFVVLKAKGGQGGGGWDSTNGGSKGAFGGVSQVSSPILSNEIAAGITYAVGAGGAHAVSDGTNGSNGSDSTASATLNGIAWSLNGGGGGGGKINATTADDGVATGGDTNLTGSFEPVLIGLVTGLGSSSPVIPPGDGGSGYVKVDFYR